MVLVGYERILDRQAARLRDTMGTRRWSCRSSWRSA